ncbi:MAG: dTMP kinase [Nitrospirae bacterium]|nr:dTMP kinase [Nitrospirota bacterium]
MKGFFISLEGIEGTGKTTQAKLLAEYLSGKGYSTVVTEEPGGTSIGLRIREVLLKVEHSEMHSLTELLLYNASRCQHIHELILPSLDAGKVVITDRFSDSTLAYQGYGRGLDLNLIETLDRIVTSGLKPDLTLLLDIDVETGLRRNRGANKVDRLELEDIAFHRKVKAGYLEIARREQERIKVVDASGGIGEIQRRIVEVVDAFITAP